MRVLGQTRARAHSCFPRALVFLGLCWCNTLPGIFQGLVPALHTLMLNIGKQKICQWEQEHIVLHAFNLTASEIWALIKFGEEMWLKYLVKLAEGELKITGLDGRHSLANSWLNILFRSSKLFLIGTLYIFNLDKHSPIKCLLYHIELPR